MLNMNMLRTIITSFSNMFNIEIKRTYLKNTSDPIAVLVLMFLMSVTKQRAVAQRMRTKNLIVHLSTIYGGYTSGGLLVPNTCACRYLGPGITEVT